MTIMNTPLEYQLQTPLIKRKELARKTLSNYPEYIPVYVGPYRKEGSPILRKQKYIVPRDITVRSFKFEILKNMDKQDLSIIFLSLMNGLNVHSEELMETLYNRAKDDDGILYVVYQPENALG